MNVAELIMLLVILAAPMALGVLAAVIRRPWWWAALGATGMTVIAATGPPPEMGEPRVAAGDIGFLIVVAIWVAGLTWLGSMIARRLLVGRRDPSTGPSP